MDDLKTLEKLIKLCRKRGVKQIKLGEIELSLTDYDPLIKPTELDSSSEAIKVSDQYTEDELLMWSSTSADPN